jgi:hypothetical protein
VVAQGKAESGQALSLLAFGVNGVGTTLQELRHEHGLRADLVKLRCLKFLCFGQLFAYKLVFHQNF